MYKDITERQREVLELIVRHYVETAEPVGSRFVSRKLDLSSATIRNVMADLEEMGYIAQPHTSAGRIPTDKGYRYYIDSLMRVRKVGGDIMKAIEDEYRQAIRSMEDVFEKTTHLMSSLTHYVGITLYPQYEKLYLDGASHILEQPEFKDFRKLHHILQCLEEKSELLNIFRDDLENGNLTIYIGKESKLNNLSDCSIVTRGYKVKGKNAGKVGVIGPKRMVYERVIPTVELMADTVSDILDKFNG